MVANFFEFDEDELSLAVTLKHLLGHHTQASHGNRHLLGRARELVKSGVKKSVALAETARAIMADDNASWGSKRSAARYLKLPAPTKPGSKHRITKIERAAAAAVTLQKAPLSLPAPATKKNSSKFKSSLELDPNFNDFVNKNSHAPDFKILHRVGRSRGGDTHSIQVHSQGNYESHDLKNIVEVKTLSKEIQDFRKARLSTGTPAPAIVKPSTEKPNLPSAFTPLAAGVKKLTPQQEAKKPPGVKRPQNAFTPLHESITPPRPARPPQPHAAPEVVKPADFTPMANRKGLPSAFAPLPQTKAAPDATATRIAQDDVQIEKLTKLPYTTLDDMSNIARKKAAAARKAGDEELARAHAKDMGLAEGAKLKLEREGAAKSRADRYLRESAKLEAERAARVTPAPVGTDYAAQVAELRAGRAESIANNPVYGPHTAPLIAAHPAFRRSITENAQANVDGKFTVIDPNIKSKSGTSFLSATGSMPVGNGPEFNKFVTDNAHKPDFTVKHTVNVDKHNQESHILEVSAGGGSAGLHVQDEKAITALANEVKLFKKHTVTPAPDGFDNLDADSARNIASGLGLDRRNATTVEQVLTSGKVQNRAELGMLTKVLEGVGADNSLSRVEKDSESRDYLLRNMVNHLNGDSKLKGDDLALAKKHGFVERADARAATPDVTPDEPYSPYKGKSAADLQTIIKNITPFTEKLREVIRTGKHPTDGGHISGPEGKKFDSMLVRYEEMLNSAHSELAKLTPEAGTPAPNKVDTLLAGAKPGPDYSDKNPTDLKTIVANSTPLVDSLKKTLASGKSPTNGKPLTEKGRAATEANLARHEANLAAANLELDKLTPAQRNAPNLPSRYDQQLDEKRSRMEGAAARAISERDAAWKRSDQISSHIPFGQPILAGHHSEGRHRRDIAKIENLTKTSIDKNSEANDLSRRAENIGMQGISSSDENAASKLAEKLDKLEKMQAHMVAVNKLVHKGDKPGLKAMGLSDTEVYQLLKGKYSEEDRPKLKSMGISDERIAHLLKPEGYPAYQLSNNNAVIRQTRQRLAGMAVNVEKPTAPDGSIMTGPDFKMRIEDERIQIKFDGKPDESLRKELRSNAFLWSPSRGTWVRKNTPNAVIAANNMMKNHGGVGVDAATSSVPAPAAKLPDVPTPAPVNAVDNILSRGRTNAKDAATRALIAQERAATPNGFPDLPSTESLIKQGFKYDDEVYSRPIKTADYGVQSFAVKSGGRGELQVNLPPNADEKLKNALRQNFGSGSGDLIESPRKMSWLQHDNGVSDGKLEHAALVIRGWHEGTGWARAEDKPALLEEWGKPPKALDGEESYTTLIKSGTLDKLQSGEMKPRQGDFVGSKMSKFTTGFVQSEGSIGSTKTPVRGVTIAGPGGKTDFIAHDDIVFHSPREGGLDNLPYSPDFKKPTTPDAPANAVDNILAGPKADITPAAPNKPAARSLDELIASVPEAKHTVDLAGAKAGNEGSGDYATNAENRAQWHDYYHSTTTQAQAKALIETARNLQGNPEERKTAAAAFGVKTENVPGIKTGGIFDTRITNVTTGGGFSGSPEITHNGTLGEMPARVVGQHLQGVLEKLPKKEHKELKPGDIVKPSHNGLVYKIDKITASGQVKATELDNNFEPTGASVRLFDSHEGGFGKVDNSYTVLNSKQDELKQLGARTQELRGYEANLIKDSTSLNLVQPGLEGSDYKTYNKIWNDITAAQGKGHLVTPEDTAAARKRLNTLPAKVRQDIFAGTNEANLLDAPAAPNKVDAILAGPQAAYKPAAPNLADTIPLDTTKNLTFGPKSFQDRLTGDENANGGGYLSPLNYKGQQGWTDGIAIFMGPLPKHNPKQLGPEPTAAVVTQTIDAQEKRATPARLVNALFSGDMSGRNDRFETVALANKGSYTLIQPKYYAEAVRRGAVSWETSTPLNPVLARDKNGSIVASIMPQQDKHGAGVQKWLEKVDGAGPAKGPFEDITKVTPETIDPTTKKPIKELSLDEFHGYLRKEQPEYADLLGRYRNQTGSDTGTKVQFEWNRLKPKKAGVFESIKPVTAATIDPETNKPLKNLTVDQFHNYLIAEHPEYYNAVIDPLKYTDSGSVQANSVQNEFERIKNIRPANAVDNILQGPPELNPRMQGGRGANNKSPETSLNSLTRAISEGEIRIRSGRKSDGSKLSQPELAAVADANERARAELNQLHDDNPELSTKKRLYFHEDTKNRPARVAGLSKETPFFLDQNLANAKADMRNADKAGDTTLTASHAARIGELEDAIKARAALVDEAAAADRLNAPKKDVTKLSALDYKQNIQDRLGVQNEDTYNWITGQGQRLNAEQVDAKIERYRKDNANTPNTPSIKDNLTNMEAVKRYQAILAEDDALFQADNATKKTALDNKIAANAAAKVDNRPPYQKYSIQDIAGHYKAEGLDVNRAFDQLIIDRQLKPGIDAKAFHKIYNAESPGLIPELSHTVEGRNMRRAATIDAPAAPNKVDAILAGPKTDTLSADQRESVDSWMNAITDAKNAPAPAQERTRSINSAILRSVEFSNSKKPDIKIIGDELTRRLQTEHPAELADFNNVPDYVKKLGGFEQAQFIDQRDEANKPGEKVNALKKLLADERGKKLGPVGTALLQHFRETEPASIDAILHPKEDTPEVLAPGLTPVITPPGYQGNREVNLVNPDGSTAHVQALQLKKYSDGWRLTKEVYDRPDPLSSTNNYYTKSSRSQLIGTFARPSDANKVLPGIIERNRKTILDPHAELLPESQAAGSLADLEEVRKLRVSSQQFDTEQHSLKITEINGKPAWTNGIVMFAGATPVVKPAQIGTPYPPDNAARMIEQYSKGQTPSRVVPGVFRNERGSFVVLENNNQYAAVDPTYYAEAVRRGAVSFDGSTPKHSIIARDKNGDFVAMIMPVQISANAESPFNEWVSANDGRNLSAMDALTSRNKKNFPYGAGEGLYKNYNPNTDTPQARALVSSGEFDNLVRGEIPLRPGDYAMGRGGISHSGPIQSHDANYTNSDGVKVGQYRIETEPGRVALVDGDKVELAAPREWANTNMTSSAPNIFDKLFNKKDAPAAPTNMVAAILAGDTRATERAASRREEVRLEDVARTEELARTQARAVIADDIRRMANEARAAAARPPVRPPLPGEGLSRSEDSAVAGFMRRLSNDEISLPDLRAKILAMDKPTNSDSQNKILAETNRRLDLIDTNFKADLTPEERALTDSLVQSVLHGNGNDGIGRYREEARYTAGMSDSRRKALEEAVRTLSQLPNQGGLDLGDSDFNGDRDAYIAYSDMRRAQIRAAEGRVSLSRADTANIKKINTLPQETIAHLKDNYENYDALGQVKKGATPVEKPNAQTPAPAILTPRQQYEATVFTRPFTDEGDSKSTVIKRLDNAAKQPNADTAVLDEARRQLDALPDTLPKAANDDPVKWYQGTLQGELRKYPLTNAYTENPAKINDIIDEYALDLIKRDSKLSPNRARALVAAKLSDDYNNEQNNLKAATERISVPAVDDLFDKHQTKMETAGTLSGYLESLTGTRTMEADKDKYQAAFDKPYPHRATLTESDILDILKKTKPGYVPAPAAVNRATPEADRADAARLYPPKVDTLTEAMNRRDAAHRARMDAELGKKAAATAKRNAAIDLKSKPPTVAGITLLKAGDPKSWPGLYLDDTTGLHYGSEAEVVAARREAAMPGHLPGMLNMTPDERQRAESKARELVNAGNAIKLRDQKNEGQGRGDWNQNNFGGILKTDTQIVNAQVLRNSFLNAKVGNYNVSVRELEFTAALVAKHGFTWLRDALDNSYKDDKTKERGMRLLDLLQESINRIGEAGGNTEAFRRAIKEAKYDDSGDSNRAIAMFKKLLARMQFEEEAKPPATINRMITVKDYKGHDRWVTLSSTAFRDRDREISSTNALKEAVAEMDTSGEYGPLRWWHVPGLDIGKCDFSMVYGRTLIESGTYSSPKLAKAFKGKELQVSLGFKHTLDQPDRNGVFNNIHIFERSVMPVGAASNSFTGLLPTSRGANARKEVKKRPGLLDLIIRG